MEEGKSHGSRKEGKEVRPRPNPQIWLHHQRRGKQEMNPNLGLINLLKWADRGDESGKWQKDIFRIICFSSTEHPSWTRGDSEDRMMEGPPITCFFVFWLPQPTVLLSYMVFWPKLTKSYPKHPILTWLGLLSYIVLVSWGHWMLLPELVLCHLKA